MRQATIMFYATNGMYGLGHIRRSITIARAIQQIRPDTRITFLSDTTHKEMIYGEGFELVSLASLLLRDAPQNKEELGQLILQQKRLVLEAYAKFRPEVLVIDYIFYGHAGILRPLIALPLLKKVLVAPYLWREEGIFEATESSETPRAMLERIFNKFDLLIVAQHGKADWPYQNYQTNTQHVGAIMERHSYPSRLALRKQLGLPENRQIVWGGVGGGGHRREARELLDTLIDIVEPVNRVVDIYMVLNTGPLAPDDEVEQLERRAAGLPVKVFKSVSNQSLYFAASDLVVCHSGYNTLCEVVSVGAASITSPRSLDLEVDQVRSGYELAKYGATIFLEKVDREVLTNQIIELLTDHQKRDGLINNARRYAAAQNGAERAAEAILSLLNR